MPYNNESWKPYQAILEKHMPLKGLSIRQKAAQIIEAEGLTVSFRHMRGVLSAYLKAQGHVIQARVKAKGDLTPNSTPPPTPEPKPKPEAKPLEIISLEREVRKHKAERDDIKKRYAALHGAFEELEGAHNAVLAIHEPSILQPIQIQPNGAHRQATAIVQFSDWHVGETVNPNTVQGLNKFNPEIAQKRAVSCFQNTLRLVRKERQNIDIDTLVIHLGGDFIGGWIHPELMQTNSMSPIEEARFAEQLLYNGLLFLREHGNFKRIVCLCSRGNHGRNSMKMQYANEAATNYETFIYTGLQRHLESMGIEFQIPEGDVGYFDVYGYKFRYYHGQQIKYNGGLGGISISLNKKQARWDQTRQAHYNLMGHFHTYSQPNPRTSLNGSLKGYDAFAASLGFEFERPIQAFTLVDSQRFITTKAPIFCD